MATYSDQRALANELKGILVGLRSFANNINGASLNSPNAIIHTNGDPLNPSNVANYINDRLVDLRDAVGNPPNTPNAASDIDGHPLVNYYLLAKVDKKLRKHRAEVNITAGVWVSKDIIMRPLPATATPPAPQQI